MNNNNFSYFSTGIKQIIPDKELTIQTFVNELRSETLKNQIKDINKIKHPDKKQEKKLRNNLKKQLPYVTPAGIFTQRNNKSLVMQSGFAPIDLDDIKDIEKLKNQLKSDPYIILIYTSPSGEGLKLLIEIPINPEDYSKRVQSFYGYLEKAYNIDLDSLDKSTSDISRACYLSYDPNLHFNPDYKVFEFLETSVKAKLSKPKDNTQSGIEFREVLKLLYLGKTKTQIFNYMQANFNKWNEQGEQYQHLTFNNATEHYENNPPNAEFKNELINDMSDEIANKFIIYTLRSDKYTPIYIYKDGIYVEHGKTYLEEYIKDCIGKYYSQNIADKIIEKIIPDTYITQEDFFKEEAPEYVCVQNGILNLLSGELEEFTPDKRFFSKLPVTYDKTKTCEATINQFKTILYPEDFDLMQELYGYLLYRDYNHQKAFIFSGDGSNGKSLTMTQIRKMLGDINVKNISLETFEKYHFMKGAMHKMMANLADDIGKANLDETRTFKELTGTGMITCDVKNHDPISFVNYGKMIFSANQIPTASDDSDGFWRRWCIIRFDMRFLEPYDFEKLKKNNKLTPKCKIMDKTIGDKLTTSDELSGVLNWAIEGFQRLHKQGFSY